MPSKLFSRLALIPFLALTLVSVSLKAEDKTFTATQEQSLEARGFIRLLEEIHYNRDAITPASYSEVIPDYMKELDGQHLFFLQSDLTEMQDKFKPSSLYWNLSSLGRLDAAFDIFKRYKTRASARTEWIFKRLEGDFDLTKDDSYAFDRKDSEWPADPAAADILWEKRLKFELLQELLNDKSIDDAKNLVHKRYERLLKNTDDFEAADLVETFLSCIAHLYDPHSTYFSADTYEDFSINMSLQLYGIGALLGIEDDLCVVKEIIPGGPADLDHQLKPNDKIIAVSQGDEEPVEIIGMKLRKIVQLIRGPKGSPVKLIVQPGNASDASVRKTISLVRDVVNLDSARAHAAVFHLPNANGEGTTPIGVITLPSFYGMSGQDDAEPKSATKDVAELINRLKDANVKGIILDLRANGGGLLNEAISLAGLFIPSGPIVQVRSYYGDVKVDSDEDPSVAYSGPLVVLTSRFSASASEIVAGALQNYGRAIIVGDSSTHGKGTVQNVIEMNRVLPMLAKDGEKTGATKLTIQKFYLPNGASTQLKGVIPDIVLPSIDDYLPIGESDLPHALKWDEITTSFYEGHPLDPALLGTLKTASHNRMESMPEFELLKKSIEQFRERQDEKTISLNLEKRKELKKQDKEFRDSLEENKKKLEESDAYAFDEIFLSPPPPPRIKAEDSDKNDGDTLGSPLEEDDNERYSKMDIHLREGLRITEDLIQNKSTPKLAEDAKAPKS